MLCYIDTVQCFGLLNHEAMHPDTECEGINLCCFNIVL